MRERRSAVYLPAMLVYMRCTDAMLPVVQCYLDAEWSRAAGIHSALSPLLLRQKRANRLMFLAFLHGSDQKQDEKRSVCVCVCVGL